MKDGKWNEREDERDKGIVYEYGRATGGWSERGEMG